MSLTISTVTVDCADAAVLARFWAGALGWDVAPGASAEFAAVGGPRRPADSPSLLFARVPEPKTVKNRWHLDLDAADPDAEVARLVALGASVRRRVSEGDAAWVTLADPEANEFCVALPHAVPG
jgi:predicted enzyme related to lactoylglutathione lyase